MLAMLLAGIRITWLVSLPPNGGSWSAKQIYLNATLRCCCWIILQTQSSMCFQPETFLLVKRSKRACRTNKSWKSMSYKQVWGKICMQNEWFNSFCCWTQTTSCIQILPSSSNLRTCLCSFSSFESGDWKKCFRLRAHGNWRLCNWKLWNLQLKTENFINDIHKKILHADF